MKLLASVVASVALFVGTTNGQQWGYEQLGCNGAEILGIGTPAPHVLPKNQLCRNNWEVRAWLPGAQSPDFFALVTGNPIGVPLGGGCFLWVNPLIIEVFVPTWYPTLGRWQVNRPMFTTNTALIGIRLDIQAVWARGGAWSSSRRLWWKYGPVRC